VVSNESLRSITTSGIIVVRSTATLAYTIEPTCGQTMKIDARQTGGRFFGIGRILQQGKDKVDFPKEQEK